MSWYTIYTKPRNEDFVSRQIESAGLNVLNPKVIHKRFKAGMVVETIEPLFPSYIFAEFDLFRFIHMINYTRGVKYTLFRDFPVVIPREIIWKIRDRMGKDGFVRIEPKRLEKGERVFIRNGPLNGFYGVFEKPLKKTERVLLLLEALNARLEIESCMVARA